MRRRWCAVSLAVATPAARAHGFGQRYDLPLPLELYICGAALTVVVSCVLLVFFVRAPPRPGFAELDLLATRAGRALAAAPVLATIRFAVVAAYLLVIVAGFVGNQSPFRNLLPVTIWALWWVGLSYFSALVGDLWKVSNPLETVFAAGERIYAKLTGGKSLSRDRPVPASMGSWPAVALYLLFLWLEIAWDGSDSPVRVAAAIAAYSAATWIAMGIFGREAWLARGEVFSRVFGLLSRFAPMRIALADRRIVEWRLRPHAIGLLEREPAHVSDVVFVVVILAAVTFDGFLETPTWAALVEATSEAAGHWPRTLALLAVPLLFFAMYWIFCRLVAMSAGVPVATRRIAGLFVFTLVPIAIAYEIAHYLSFLVQAGQYLIPLASDPFGWGWNLFGTANYFVRIGIVDARLVWIVSMGAIVAGHVAALYLGHALSMREFPDRSAAVRSQGPMLVLMVAYTMLSLWIIAQPIVTSR